MPSLTISYRREDAAADAGRIYDRLVSHYGKASVFMDVDAIPYATDYRTFIDRALRDTDVVIAIIGTRWRGGRGAAARIMDDNDPVRVEIETAMARGKIVLPVLVNGAKMPKPSDLPATLAAFHFLNAASVDEGRNFHSHLDSLIAFIDGELRRAGRLDPAGPNDTAKPAASTEPPAVPRWRRTASLVLRVAVGPIVVVTLAFVAFGLAAVHESSAAFWLQTVAAFAVVVAGCGMLLLAAWCTGSAAVRAGRLGAIDTLQAGAAATALGVAAFTFAQLTSVHFVGKNFDGRLLESTTFRQWVGLLPPPQRSSIELAVVNRLRAEYGRITRYYGNHTEADFTFARQMVAFVDSFDSLNGHALYYDGQINHVVNAKKPRVVRLKENVYSPWRRYLNNVTSMPQLDDYKHDSACYRDLAGYCRERSAWIRYVLAFTNYCASQELAESRDQLGRKPYLDAARSLLQASLDGWPEPFTDDGESHAMMALIQHDLAEIAHGRVPPKNPNEKACP